jgi:capsular polysaccharide biosynthesis protein
MEQEIDLRPYLQAIIRQWRMIVGLMVLLGALATAWTIVAPRSAQARGDLLVIAQSSQLTLDPRFAQRDATMLTNSVNQRQALIDLASSSVLEARVAQALGITVYHAGELLAKIKVTATSDLIQISATASTSDEALRLAEAWTHTYAALVNELFSGASPATPQIDEQLTGAQQRFEDAQTALTTLYASGELVRVRQQVARLDALLNGGIEAQVRLYTEYLSRTQELSLILEDARALQATNEVGASGDLNAGLAALAVRARLAGAAKLPVQLTFASAESFAQGQANATDLTHFMTVLESEHKRMVGQAEALARDLAASDGSAVGLPPDVRTRYESDLATAQGVLARAEGQEALLLQRRTVALSSLQVLQTKRDEGQIAQVAPEVSVRFVGVATVAPRSLTVNLGLNLVMAILVGLILAITWIVGREIVRRVSTPAGRSAATS